MNKLTKVLSIFLIAGLIGTGTAVGLTGCNKDKNKECTTHVDENKDGKCDNCGLAMPEEKPDPEKPDPEKPDESAKEIVVTTDVTGLQVEGVVTSYKLSETLKAADIDVSNIKVYLDKSGTKGDEVPAANYKVSLWKGSTKLDSLTGIKEEGSYILLVDLTGVKKADGSAVAEEEVCADITIVVSNPIVSLALKSGTTAFNVGAVASTADWTFEAVRANGDKSDVPAADVKVGAIDTFNAGKVSISYNGASGSVDYTLNVDDNKVIQSYAMNFNGLTNAQVLDGVSLDDEGEVTTDSAKERFYVVSNTGGEIASHGKYADGRYFEKRLKVNGASTAKKCSRYIKVKADGAATLVVYAYCNTGTEGTASTRGIAVYKSRTAKENSDAADAYADQVGTTQTTIEKVDTRHEFQLPAAGEYYITCDAGMTFTYVQLNQILDKAGNTAHPLGGKNVVSTLSVATKDAKKTYKLGDTFSSDKVVVSAVISNSLTCAYSEEDVTASAVFTAPDMSTLGEKDVTVTYTPAGGTAVSTTYKIKVESEVAGVLGANANLKKGLETTVAAGAKLTVKKSDVEVALVGTAPEGATTTYTVKSGSTEVTDTGVEFEIGTHKLTVEITVTAGDKTAKFTKEIELVVNKKAGALTTVATHTMTVAGKAIVSESAGVFTSDSQTTNNDADLKFGKDADKLIIKLDNLKAGQVIEVLFSAKSGSSDSNSAVAVAAEGATGAVEENSFDNSAFVEVKGSFTVSADGTVTLTVTRGVAKTLRIESATVTIKQEA